jgi:hypothetical protein
MNPVRARVRDGRFTLDEPTDLPEGTEVELVVAEGDELTDDDRAALHRAMESSMQPRRPKESRLIQDARRPRRRMPDVLLAIIGPSNMSFFEYNLEARVSSDCSSPARESGATIVAPAPQLNTHRCNA